MTNKGSKGPRARSNTRVSHRLSREQRRQQILRVAEEQFAATGLRATNTVTLARAAGSSEAMLYRHFGTKQQLFQEVVERNTLRRLAALRDRFFAIPDMPPLECIQSMAESTILACVDDIGNASVMVWGLMELPEFAAGVYRTEIGATEALWNSEVATRLADSPLRTWVIVHLVPYAAHVCMAFGLWLAALRHKPATAQAHARQFADGFIDVARALLNFPTESFEAATYRQPEQGESLR